MRAMMERRGGAGSCGARLQCMRHASDSDLPLLGIGSTCDEWTCDEWEGEGGRGRWDQVQIARRLQSVLLSLFGVCVQGGARGGVTAATHCHTRSVPPVG